MSVEKTYSEFLSEIFHRAYILKSGHALPATYSPEYEQIHDGNFNEIVKLEIALNEAKAHTGKILLSHREWHAHTAFLHPLKQLPKVLRQKYDIEFCTQAYCKFTEILAMHPILVETPTENDEFRSFHLCEAPGGFVAALNNFLGDQRKCTWKWSMNTLNPYNEYNHPEFMLLDDTLIYPNLGQMEFGPDNTGDILKWDKNFISRLPKFHLVTADGSFDVRDEPENQETLVYPLIEQEVSIALKCLEKNGNLVVKIFTFCNHDTIHLLNKLLTYFNEVVIRKPACSKASNSEVYVVCVGFVGDVDEKHGYEMKNGIFHQERSIRFNLKTFNTLSATEKCFINEKNFDAINRWIELNFKFDFPIEELHHIKQVLCPWANVSWNLDTNRWAEIVQKCIDSASSTFPGEPIELYWSMGSLVWLIDGRFEDDVVVVGKASEPKRIVHSLFVNLFLLKEAKEKNLYLIDFASGPHFSHSIQPKIFTDPILIVDTSQMDKSSWLELLVSLPSPENVIEELHISTHQNDIILSRFSASIFVLFSIIFASVKFEDTGNIRFKNKLNTEVVLNAAETYAKNLLKKLSNSNMEILSFVPMSCFHRSDVYKAISYYNNKKILDLIRSA